MILYHQWMVLIYQIPFTDDTISLRETLLCIYGLQTFSDNDAIMYWPAICKSVEQSFENVQQPLLVDIMYLLSDGLVW